MAKNKRWVVTTSGDRSMEEVERELRDCGFDVDEVLDAIGVVTGSGDDDAAEKMRRVAGVTDVSPEPGGIDVGPPGSPITW